MLVAGRCLTSFLLLSLLAAPAAAGPLPVVRDHLKIGAGAGGFPGEIPERASFGWGLASLGDRDGDGAPELAIGAHFDPQFGHRAGALWLAELEPDGSVREARKLGATADGFAARLAPEDGFGLAVAVLGDIDGDGHVEIAVSAPGDSDAGPHTGAVYVLSLMPDERVVARSKISGRRAWARTAPWTWVLPDRLQGGFLGELLPGDMFGASLETVGDLDGDGVPELAVGMRDTSVAGRMRGVFWILFLRSDATVKRAVRIGSGEGGFAVELDEEDAFGIALAALGDLDGDGVPDLAVGAPGDDDGGNALGAVYVLFLERDGGVRAHRKISASEGGFTGVLNPKSEFGIALTAVPDLDGNGVVDLAVGARGDDAAGPYTGAVWLLSLERDGSVVQQRHITVGQGGLEAELAANDVFGSGLAVVGDLDGDGLPELAAGAEGDDAGGTNSGAVWILFLGLP